MYEREAMGAPEIVVSEEAGDDGATDIVGRTGEEMPLAMHDQGHRDFRAAVANDDFDPRLAPRQRTGRSA